MKSLTTKKKQENKSSAKKVLSLETTRIRCKSATLCIEHSTLKQTETQTLPEYYRGIIKWYPIHVGVTKIHSPLQCPLSYPLSLTKFHTSEYHNKEHCGITPSLKFFLPIRKHRTPMMQRPLTPNLTDLPVDSLTY